ncbi:hypothetical protein SLS53_006735 [Cytospora paraplurivora]|uniref:Dethiobiotin synthase n=1 Tax=Cytospora paraplurivora TaxID=2898453 RepID=A0AAN9YEE1_9PEZI
MAPVGSILWRNLRVYQIYGANTDVGKTVLTTLLCRASTELCKSEQTSFLKPVSTGPEDEADTRYDLFQQIPSDAALLSLIHANCSRAASAGPGWLFLETAGGVHSPSPSGTTQADLYSPLRLPVVLVGDAKLGGISLTISAFETLRLRGYDVESILMFENDVHENAAYLREYFKEKFGVPVVGVEAPPERLRDQRADEKRMMAYYAQATARGTAVLKHLAARHAERINRLESMPLQTLLTPETITAIDSAKGDFFQTLVPKPPIASSASNPSSLPSVHSKNFSQDPVEASAASPLLQPSFDGSASWWTQGLGHGAPSLTLAAAYAAGRYGHVMFAETVHEPALRLAEALLEGMHRAGNHRLTRVFYSDNGSTGVEVALKMALRAAAKRYGWDETDAGTDQPAGVVALRGGYHGDTLGAMECAEPSAYNRKVDWYRGRGVWLDYPTMLCVEGRWVVHIPGTMAGERQQVVEFETLSHVFDLAGRRHDNMIVAVYEEYIERTLRDYLGQGRKLGALLIEPVVIGAGGMILADPLFQHVLVDLVRRSSHLFGTAQSQSSPRDGDWTGLPVIFDEVFTGLYRVGHFTSSTLIDAQADISVHAKLLTGGLVPLCTTLASESIFEAFKSNDKTDALLHGHSYTAHAVGCQVAVESLRQLTGKEHQEKRESFRFNGGWMQPGADMGASVWSMWTLAFVKELSHQPRVAGIWALGNVLAIHLRAPDGAGYTSTAAIRLREELKRGPGEEGFKRWNVHSRVLGNVLYLMGSQAMTEEGVEEIAELVKLALSV